MPTPAAVGTPGFFAHGGGATAYTVLTSDWCNAVQSELLGMLTAAGITADKTNVGQLLLAYRTLLPAAGQCRLSVVSTTQIIMKPLRGNQLTINGVNYDIPQAGVTLANTALVAATLYYVYAFMSGGITMTLEAVTTGHSTDATTANYGVEIKTGDSSRSLIGMVYMGAGTPGVFVADGGLNKLCLNWFNRRSLSLQGGNVGSTTTSLSLVSVGSASTLNFLSWGDEATVLSLAGSASNGTAGDGWITSIWLDGGANGSQGGGTSGTAGAISSAQGQVSATLTEGVHVATPSIEAVTGGTVTYGIAIQGVSRG